VSLAADDPRHGTVNGYRNLACRCAECRAASTTYLRDYRQLGRSGAVDKRRRDTASVLVELGRKLISAGEIPKLIDIARLSGYSDQAVRRYFANAAGFYAACGYRLALVPIDVEVRP